MLQCCFDLCLKPSNCLPGNSVVPYALASDTEASTTNGFGGNGSLVKQGIVLKRLGTLPRRAVGQYSDFGPLGRWAVWFAVFPADWMRSDF